MSGGYNETIDKDEEDDAGNTFVPNKWAKMDALFGTVQCDHFGRKFILKMQMAFYAFQSQKQHNISVYLVIPI